MKTIATLLAAAVLLTGFTGCADRIVYRDRYVPIPKQFMQRCNVTAPPSKSEFVAGSCDQRVGMLSDTTSALYVDLGVCNARGADALAEYDAKMRKLYGIASEAQ